MNAEKEKNVQNRSWLVSRIRAEVVGPDPSGKPIIPLDVDPLPACSWSEFRTPKTQINEQEVLWQDPPLKRYGAGILYPAGSYLSEVGNDDVDTTEGESSPSEIEYDGGSANDSVLSRDIKDADDSEDYDVSLANAMSPSAIGLSLVADLSKEPDAVVLELADVVRQSAYSVIPGSSAIYRGVKITVRNENSSKESERTVWLRTPLEDTHGNRPQVVIRSDDFRGAGTRVIRKSLREVAGLEFVVVSRPWKQSHQESASLRLLTATLVNKNGRSGGGDNERAIFQAGIRVFGRSGNGWIVPYPEIWQQRVDSSEDMLSDEAINRVLYREHRTYAIGHGCSADWSDPDAETVSEIWSDVLPVCETPGTTAELDIVDASGNSTKLKVSMRKLAGLDPDDSGRAEIDLLVSQYQSWIQGLRKNELPLVDIDYRGTGKALVRRCEQCLDRIRDGIDLLDAEGEPGRLARRAFKLANHAMLLAQLRGGAPVRTPKYTAEGVTWDKSAEFHDPAIPHPHKGYWRPFQIAFLLMSLRGICEREHDDRDIVDLIWFPTGGGKTEAYLGVTAFTIFYNRLAGRQTDGCDVLMRYTLRLLTAQQFQRAATLFCAMDMLRSGNEEEVGMEPFTLGLWVGSATTPNTRQSAIQALKKLEKNPAEENPFVMLRCPWCAARMGPLADSTERTGRGRRGGGWNRNQNAPSVIGYERSNSGPEQTVVYQCPDKKCDFGAGSVLSRGRLLPLTTIDEDLIERPPRLLIGTVDKFAQLAWKPDLRRFFGIAEDGQHHSAPPSLIIQDELHLISGPLGTMVGAYETVIDRLCREHGVGDIGPKIIASTATISRAREQIQHLYARKESMLFPPSGLRSSDSFFAREENGPGRMYLGVMAPAYYSLQTTEARIFASLLQSVAQMPTDESGKDPWWTLLCFFNSLRELGVAGTLMVADVREYMRVLMDRHGWSYKAMRNTMASELTSRIRGDDIPKELAKLEVALSKDGEGRDYPVDVCLASSIIEVGVDLPRLSLMSIVGQPKSTSQYIQVSSRVGRGKDKPGLVVVLYGQSKPRDRSHYERFRGYHQKLYAQVEPTSVTPFSTPAIERALHGILVAAVRQLGEQARGGQTPRPCPITDESGLDDLLVSMFRERADAVSEGEETEAVLELLDKRIAEWHAWDPAEYGTFGGFSESPSLLHPAGANPPVEWNGHSWPTLMSLRNVDASGEAEITDWFNSLPSQGGQK